MRPRRTEELKRSQRTVRNFGEAPTADHRLEECYRYFERMQSHMLIEDIQTQILPYEGRSRKTPFSIELDPASDTLEPLVASAFKGRDHYSRHELARAVADFIRECAQSVVCFGQATYELVYLSREEEPGKYVAFELEQVRPLTVKRSGNKFIQTIPAEVAKKLAVPRFIDLPAESILMFELPTSLKKFVSRTLDSLAVLSEKLIPEFAMKDFATAASLYRYDSANQVYSQKLALAEAGKQIGWNARMLFNEEMLEFYQLKRQLRFERFKLQLRDSILETLNRGLVTAGTALGFQAKIKVSGLPTLSDIELAEADLESGGKAFGDILGQFLYY